MSKNLTKFLLFIGLAVLFNFTPLPDESVKAQTSAFAQGAQSPRANFYRQEVNKGTVGIISGGIAGTYIRIATDLASVLDDRKNQLIRVLPIAGKGGVRNIQDLLYLKGIDFAIVQSDVLDFIENKNMFSNIRNRVHYITKLYNAELHIITRKEITDVRQLNGKTVNFWNKGSATDMTGTTVFKALDMRVKSVHLDQQLALEKLKTGEIAANMLLVGKPSKHFAGIKESDGLHLLPINFEGKVAEIYLPSSFSSNDYPGLVSAGTKVPTVASGAVLAVYNWPKDHPRYKKVSRFIDAFFDKFSEFRKAPRHKKWKEVNLNTKLPGWKRFSHAQSRLSNKGPGNNSLAKNFKNFLAASGTNSQGLQNLSGKEQEKLFKKFLQWQQQSR